MTAPAPWPGRPAPLGATWDGSGTNFALFSPGAEEVDICLLGDGDGGGDGGNGDGGDRGGEQRVPLTELTHHVWHGYLPGVGPGQRYGYRVDGPWDPAWGARWNASKLLLDPYARALDGRLVLDDAVFGHVAARDDLVQDHRDSAPYVPHSVVVDPAFDWGDDRPPATPWARTVVYELHVRGFTMRHPGVPEALRGTYAGLAHPAAIEHLTSLGVTAVELLPVHHFVDEPALLRRGLTNYWGYNSVGFFAPHGAYSASGSRGGQVREFKEMVRALHAAGLEVILDVVFNHSGEGDELGPTLSFRGIDNGAYYRLAEGDARRYRNDTGTGNTLNVRHPHVLQLVMDSLRYWVAEMHVDGFRFDLATTLARTERDYDRFAPFLSLVAQDPVVSQVKLIAEPWDLAPGGYQVGRFPPPWAEWNGRYRDSVRDFWRGAPVPLAELGYRLSGSSDLYADGRRPWASVNFVTAHDGFTLHDLVSYERKRNDGNGEHNRDGTDDNRSWNCGAEGPTDDPAVLALRARQQRNLLATLLLSAGTPMLTAGDEIGRTQHGSNNAYCQDNELSWLDWTGADADLLVFARDLLALRRAHPVLRRSTFFTGRAVHGDGVKDVGWFDASGRELDDGDWAAPATTLGMFLDGSEIADRGPRGERVAGESFLVLLHAGAAPVEFTLPGEPWATAYDVVLASAPPECAGDAAVRLAPHSIVVLHGRRTGRLGR